MAALTWREVSAPNFGTSNDLLRQASVSRDRAFAGLADTLKTLETDQTNGANNSLLLKASQIQDPAQLRKQLVDGSLFAGVDPNKVDPRILESVNSRVGQLLSQSAAEQNIVAGKQAIDSNTYKQTRLESENANEDSARGQLAASLGLTGALANLPTDEQQGVAKTRSGLRGDALNQQGTVLMNEARSFNNSTAKRNDAADQGSLARSAELLSRNATTDDLRQDFLSGTYSTPQEQDQVRKRLEQATGQRLFAPIDADVPAGTTKGGAPSGSGGAGAPTSVVAQAALQDLGRRASQNNSVGIVADIEKNLADTRSAPEVAKEISLNFPEADQGKINGMISKAMSDYPGLSAADIGSAISRSTTGDWLGSTGIASGVGVDDDSFKAVLEDLSAGKADYNSAQNQRVRSVGSGISKADADLANARTELSKVRRRANSQPGIDTSAAEARVERMQEALNKALSRAEDDELFQPIYKKAPVNKPEPTMENFSNKNKYRNQ